jgi:hypothetical protein
MKYALVCPNEDTLDGYRVAEVQDAIPWEAAPPTYWMECADEVNANTWYFKDGAIIERTDISINSGLQSM